jgi:Domain of unknown function (DUF4111)
MAKIPFQVTTLVQSLATDLPMILGRNLVGIYLYGSLTQRAFNPQSSDVDCLVVTQRELSETQFSRLGDWLARTAETNPWGTRLQMSLLLRRQLLTPNSRACLCQFGSLKRSSSDGNPIIWLNVLKSGVILFGPPPETFVPTITPEILFQALEREVGYLRKEISENPQSEWRDVPRYRAYAVLTLCRILYSFRKGTVASKPQAARWAFKHLPGQWHKIIRQAQKNGAAKRPEIISLTRLRQFIAYADAQLHTVPANLREK